MAISNLVGPQGQSFNRPGVSTFFGAGKGPSNDNVVKTSSSMFDETFFTNAIQALTGITAEVKRIQDTAKKTVLGLNRVIKSLKDLSRNITQRFGALNSEISGNRVDMARNMVNAPAAPSIDDGMPVVVAKNDKPTTPAATGAGGGGFGMTDLLTALGGPKVLNWLTTIATSTLGSAFFSAAAGGLAALGVAMFAAAGLGDLIEKWTGIKEKLAAMEKTPEYQEMRGAQQSAAQRAAGGTGGPAGRAKRTDQRQTIINKFGLKAGDLSQDPTNPNIMVHKDGRKFDLSTGNVVPGASPTPSTPTPSAPAPSAPAPSAPAPSAPAAPGASSSSGGIDPAIAAKAANYREMGRKGVALPPEIAADPLHGPSALTAWKEGQAEGMPVRSKYSRKPDEKGGRDLDQSGMQDDTGIDVGQHDEELKLTGLPLKVSRELSGDSAYKQGEINRYVTDPRPDVPLGSVADLMYNGNEDDRKKRYLDYQTNPDAAGKSPMQAGYQFSGLQNQYDSNGNLVQGARGRTSVSFSELAARAGRPQGSALAPGEGIMDRLSPGMPGYGSGGATVINTSSSTNIGSTEGGEANNVAGTNLPLSAINPHIQEFLAKQNLQYQ